MTTSSGYLRRASKSAGLCSTPSIVVPSWLFHETTSRELPTQPVVCAFMSVNLRGDVNVAGATYTSDIVFESAPRNATFAPSREKVKLDPIHSSAGARRVVVFVAGSSRYRYDHVCCDAEKKIPPAFHASSDGFSSNDIVSGSIVPPEAGMTAMPWLANDGAPGAFGV